MLQRAVFRGNGEISVETTVETKPKSGEVRIKVAFCAACGSDNRLFRRGSTVVPGHEISGVVDEVGEDVPPDLLGKHVVVYIPLYCGVCRQCSRGWTNQCQKLEGLVGWQRDGGYQTHVCVPERNIWLLPDDVELDEAPLLLDTLGTTGHAMDKAFTAVSPSKTAGALVLGFGPLGFGSAVVLKDAGLADISIYEPNPTRSSLASEVGFREINPNQNAYDLVVEASGHPIARKTALESVAPHGVVVLLGENDNPWIVEPTVGVRRKDFLLVRSFYFPYRRFPVTVETLRRQRLLLRRLIVHRRALNNLEETIRDFANGLTFKPLTYPDIKRQEVAQP